MSQRPEGLLPLCLGKANEWEDTSLAGVERTRKVCAVCPVREWCSTEARHAVAEGLPISGVWAGVAYASGTERSEVVHGG